MIKEISKEEANRLCKDVQLCWRGRGNTDGWRKDFSPKDYRESMALPSGWDVEYGIKIDDDDKPEYTPNG
jgi:hypothetical protein